MPSESWDCPGREKIIPEGRVRNGRLVCPSPSPTILWQNWHASANISQEELTASGSGADYCWPRNKTHHDQTKS